MIDQLAIDAYNTRIRATISDLAKLTTAQKDAVKNHGSKAEALLANHDLVQFIHQSRFEMTDAISNISGHSEEDNNRRVALANQLSGLDSFVATLQRAVYMKNRVVADTEATPASKESTKMVYTP